MAAPNISSIIENLAAQRNVEEIKVFLQVSHRLFDEKLTVIEEEINLTTAQEERDILKQKAIQLYEEYKHSLTLMEQYLEEIDSRT